MSVSAPDPLAVFTTTLTMVTAPPPPGEPPKPPDLLGEVPPFERSAPEIQAVLRVVANELLRLEEARQALILNFLPGTADALLPMFEEMLGLPVAPPGLALASRQQLVLATMRRLKGQGRGLDWEATITALFGTSWSYQEYDPNNANSPPPNTLSIKIPQAYAGFGWPFIRDLTPAHLAITEGYSDGFFVGITNIGGNL